MYKNNCLHNRALTLICAITVFAFCLLPIQANATDALVPSWQGVWEGTIGKSQVMVCLAANGKSSYKYQRYQADIPLLQNDEEWEESVNGVVSGIWRLSEAKGDSLDGDWQNPKSQRKLPIRLKKIATAENGSVCSSSAYTEKLPTTVDQTKVGIPGLENVRDIVASDHKTCALLNDGNVKCWGMADSQNKITLEDMHRNDVDAIAMAATGGVLCTVSRNKTVSCSGNPRGIVSFSNFGTSAPVSVSISPSAEFMCVLADDGRVQCAGANAISFFVEGVSNAKSIALGWDTACAVLKNSHVKCWDKDFIADEIRGVNNAKSVTVGDDYACVLFQNGTAKCWGANDNGQLGNGVSDSSDLPVRVLYLKNALVILQSSRGNTCALLRTGGIKCWGPSFGDAIDHASVANDIEGVSNVTSITMSRLFICDVEKDKTVKCGNFDSPFMYKVIGLSDVIKLVGSGFSHMCALLENGRVKCWDLFHSNPNVSGSVIFDGESQ